MAAAGGAARGCAERAPAAALAKPCDLERPADLAAGLGRGRVPAAARR